MGKLKGIKIPRKLKKEFEKVDCIEKTQPRFNHPKNPFQTSKFEFITYQTVKLKDGVKVNKWTKRLVRNIYREIKREQKQALDRMIEKRIDWAHKGISLIDSFAETMKRKSPDEFRREYLNEPIPENDAVFKGLPELDRYSKVRQLDNGLKPGFIIIDDMDDSMPNFRTKQEEMEWIERVKLWHASMIQPDADGDCFAPKAVIKIKEGAISPDKLEEFKREWNKQMKSGKPLILGEEATVEFIPSKRPHRLHNHPKKEMELCAEDEVIVDVEFMGQFCWYRPLIDSKTGKYDQTHVIVRKNEYRALIDRSQERERETRILTTYREKRYYVDEVFAMLSASYREVSGGLLYRSGEELLSKQNNVWKLLYTPSNDRAQVIIIWKETEFGRKMVACGCTQTSESKRLLLEELHRDLERGNIWAEVSDKIELWLRHCEVPQIPFVEAQELLKGKHLIPLEDGFHYKREIQGIIKTKVVYGKINKQRKSDSRLGEDS